jgi:type II secretory pathway component PulJ
MKRGHRATAGFTLVDLLCAAGLIAIAMGAALITFVGVQRSLTTSLYQVDAQNDQNRVFAYLRRDLRGASNVQLAAQGTQVTLTIPTQAAPTFNLNLGPSLLSLLGPSQTAGATNTIRYYRQGTSIIREYNGAPAVLSASATAFQVSLNGSLVEIDASFQPRYSFGSHPTSTTATTFSAYVHLLDASN